MNEDEQKEYFSINEEENNLINQLYIDYNQGYDKIDIAKINELFQIKNMGQYFKKGLKKYIFSDTKNNYIIFKNYLLIIILIKINHLDILNYFIYIYLN